MSRIYISKTTLHNPDIITEGMISMTWPGSTILKSNILTIMPQRQEESINHRLKNDQNDAAFMT